MGARCTPSRHDCRQPDHDQHTADDDSERRNVKRSNLEENTCHDIRSGTSDRSARRQPGRDNKSGLSYYWAPKVCGSRPQSQADRALAPRGPHRVHQGAADTNSRQGQTESGHKLSTEIQTQPHDP
jgi:hypothetical protein